MTVLFMLLFLLSSASATTLCAREGTSEKTKRLNVFIVQLLRSGFEFLLVLSLVIDEEFCDR